MNDRIINHGSPVPLYHQIKDILSKRIQDETWKVGDLIPTEQELIKEFGVSRTTIRQAITALVQEDLLEKRQGRGTIVRPTKLTGSLQRLTGFAEEVLERGYKPYSKLLRAEVRDDLMNEKRKLELPEPAKIVLIERIRFANDEPIAIERTCWPEDVGTVLLDHDLNGAKFYQILEDHKIYLREASETITAVNATPYEADMLGVNGGESLLQMKRISYGMGNRPIEFTKTKYRSDRYQYNVHLKR
ncbi:GntR family transcriptional regulator [Thalassobacillus devorans]|uniref:GntR family transcriptional regulator n=1 Tax=Thalassobacillus devorans TaxID=279813 RepID=A0ABQ1NU40_9BACI|nr:GntR family transcriptional regulator [Thalassobacillus devorans]NIK28561.1 GntR family transcriptional regulator [Thalassobacillus devorans]GGC85266.1 GntR family transcriptional regulator [Thalassobacillus devorans]